MTTPEDARISHLYDRIAREQFAHAIDERVFRLTEDSVYRRRAIEALQLTPGAHVLDAACGTGLNFKLLRQAIGEDGHITGVDISPGSLQIAHRRIEKNNWRNINLIQYNLAEYKAETSFDGVLCTFAISIIPDYEAALRRMFALLKPGGSLVILGMQPASQWPYRLINPIWRWMNRTAGADITRDIPTAARSICDMIDISEHYGTLYFCLIMKK
ncbi:MAG: methyltransferase domain-containing protein [Chloroflexi bacterium]|nr:MAG: methyltransferase domain-containing protein [Chloroflexota bacterium]